MRSSFSGRHLVAVGLFLLLACGGSVARAADQQLWGALVMADNQPEAKPLPAELAPYGKRLAKVFGYRNFQILQASSHSVAEDDGKWLISGENFSLQSFVKPAEDASFRVSLELFQGHKEIVQTDARLGAGSPLLIRGPLYGDGQLIIVILVQPKR